MKRTTTQQGERGDQNNMRSVSHGNLSHKVRRVNMVLVTGASTRASTWWSIGYDVSAPRCESETFQVFKQEAKCLSCGFVHRIHSACSSWTVGKSPFGPYSQCHCVPRSRTGSGTHQPDILCHRRVMNWVRNPSTRHTLASRSQNGDTILLSFSVFWLQLRLGTSDLRHKYNAFLATSARGTCCTLRFQHKCLESLPLTPAQCVPVTNVV